MNSISQFFQTMYTHELILMILGIILFFVALWAFIYQVKKGPIEWKYGLYFLLPLVFIGYPSIQSFSFMKDILSFETKITQLADQPENEDLKEGVKEEVERLESRPLRSFYQANVLLEAHIVLNQFNEADSLIQKLEMQKPDSELLAKNRSIMEIAKAEQELKENPDRAELNTMIKIKADELRNKESLRSIDRIFIEKVDNQIP